MLTKEEVLHVAKLARLDLTETEVEKFRTQLSGILDLFKKIDDLKLENVAETSQVTGLSNVLRGDKVSCREDLTCCTVEQLLKNVPIMENSTIKVPKVIGGSNDA